MQPMTQQDRTEKRESINPWKPKERKLTVNKQETIEQFLLRGGQIKLCSPPKIDLIACSRKCCTSTFERLM